MGVRRADHAIDQRRIVAERVLAGWRSRHVIGRRELILVPSDVGPVALAQVQVLERLHHLQLFG